MKKEGTPVYTTREERVLVKLALGQRSPQNKGAEWLLRQIREIEARGARSTSRRDSPLERVGRRKRPVERLLPLVLFILLLIK